MLRSAYDISKYNRKMQILDERINVGIYIEIRAFPEMNRVNIPSLPHTICISFSSSLKLYNPYIFHHKN